MNKNNNKWIPDSKGPSGPGVLGLSVSVLIHGGIVVAAVMLGSFTFAPQIETPDMLISIADAKIPINDLPPLGEGQEAGPINTNQPADSAPQANENETVIEEPELDREKPVTEEDPVVEEQKPVEEEKKPDPIVEEKPKPVEKKPEPKKETKPKDTQKEIVSTNPTSRQSKEAEIKPEPEPTPQEVARELQQQRGTRSRSFRGAGGGNATGLIASGNQGGGVSSGPALYNSNLTQLISMNWQPPAYRPGEVRDCTVEFTIYSPPLERNAVNKVRVARVTNIRILKSSGDEMYDQRAMEAVRRIRSWPPPPDSYRKETLTVTCRFYLVGDE